PGGQARLRRRRCAKAWQRRGAGGLRVGRRAGGEGGGGGAGHPGAGGGPRRFGGHPLFGGRRARPPRGGGGGGGRRGGGGGNIVRLGPRRGHRGWQAGFDLGRRRRRGRHRRLDRRGQRFGLRRINGLDRRLVVHHLDGRSGAWRRRRGWLRGERPF